MSFKLAALALVDALIEDTEPFAPYAMAAMREYGKVAGYAPAYEELRADVLGFLRLMAELGLREVAAGQGRAPLEEAASLPPLTPNRLISHEFFEREKAVLLAALRHGAAVFEAAPDGELNRRYAALDGAARDAFRRLLHRSGLDPNLARAAEGEPAAPLLATAVAAAAGGREKIYVSSRYSQKLRDQIAEVLAEGGLDPVTPTAAPASFPLDLARVERDLRGCAGGVFGLAPPAQRAAAETAEQDRSSRALAPGLAEIAMAERQMGGNLIILAQERLVPQLPARLRARPIFRLRAREMDAEELTEFRSVTARTPWLAH